MRYQSIRYQKRERGENDKKVNSCKRNKDWS